MVLHSEVIIALPPSGAEPLEVLAAQELRRAIYSSSGELCDIVRADAALAAAEGADESAGEAGRGRSVPRRLLVPGRVQRRSEERVHAR